MFIQDLGKYEFAQNTGLSLPISREKFAQIHNLAQTQMKCCPNIIEACRINVTKLRTYGLPQRRKKSRSKTNLFFQRIRVISKKMSSLKNEFTFPRLQVFSESKDLRFSRDKRLRVRAE